MSSKQHFKVQIFSKCGSQWSFCIMQSQYIFFEHVKFYFFKSGINKFLIGLFVIKHWIKCRWNGYNWCFNGFDIVVLVTIQRLFFIEKNFTKYKFSLHHFFDIVYQFDMYCTYVQYQDEFLAYVELNVHAKSLYKIKYLFR